MIPITFNKDDLNNEKKGTMRAQDLASLVGLLYSKKVGILDIFDNALSITNVDLSTTGYVKLTFNKGYVNIFGRLIYVEQGEIVTFELPANTESGSLGIRINLAESGANEVAWFMSSTTLQTDNILNENANGVYEMAIYTYTANSTAFTLGTKVAQTIQSLPDYMGGANFTTPALSDNSTKLATTEFVQGNLSQFEPRLPRSERNAAGWSKITIGGAIDIVSGTFEMGGNSTKTNSLSLWTAKTVRTVTVTPAYRTAVVYIKEINGNTFKVESSSSSATIHFIAICYNM